MSAYLPSLSKNSSVFNAEDYNYQDESITFHTADDRYFKSLKNTEHDFLENISSNVQTQINNLIVERIGGGIFNLIGESQNINASNNSGYCFSFGNGVSSIKSVVVNGDVILNKFYIETKQTIANSRTDNIVFEKK